MNKKLKAFISLTIVIQLLVPSFLLVHNYFVLSTAKSLETEYKFRLNYISFDDYYLTDSDNPTEQHQGIMRFAADRVFSYGDEKNKVLTTPGNTVIGVPKLEKGDDTDIWFYNKYYRQNCKIAPDKYSFEEGIDARAIKAEIRIEALKDDINGNEEKREFPYLTAKIYKGVFLPTAIYFKGEKIISINL